MLTGETDYVKELITARYLKRNISADFVLCLSSLQHPQKKGKTKMVSRMEVPFMT